LLVRDLILPRDGVFIRSGAHGAQWTAGFNIELMNRCADTACGLLIFHRHHGDPVRMSSDDRQSAEKLMPLFQDVVPQRYHGSIVLGDTTSAGLIWSPGKRQPTESIEVRLLGSSFETYRPTAFAKAGWKAFARVPLAAGSVTRHILRCLAVGIVGLSGGGSQLVTQLAAMGFGRFVLVDPQRFDWNNRISSDAPRVYDLAFHLRKTSVAKRQILAIDPRCSVRCVHAEVPSEKAFLALREVDIIVGCVNNLHARADILEFAGRYGIPYVDIGFNIGLDEGSEAISSMPGNVFTAVPGDACMWCTSFLTKAKLEKEAGGQDRSYFKSKGRRVQVVHDPVVLPFNGELASAAAIEVLQLALGYRGQSSASSYKKYDGLTGEMHVWGLTKTPQCPHCTNVVHAGDPIWL
jgi:molybdopterin/thiamine biosynthesis adenylyltransferase